jgi:hypothetical protein
MSCVGRDDCQSARAARTCTSLRSGSSCCVGTAWTRCCKTARRQCREPVALKSMIDLDRANRSWGRRCLPTHGDQRRNRRGKRQTPSTRMTSMRCASLTRVRPRTAAKSHHPANPAHEPEPSRLLPCVDIAGRQACLARALQAAGSSPRFRGRGRIVSCFQDIPSHRDLNNRLGDFHPEEPGLIQLSELCATQQCAPGRLFSKAGWNQKPVALLHYSGSAHWVPISGCHVLFERTAGRAEEREATPRGSVS